MLPSAVITIVVLTLLLSRRKVGIRQEIRTYSTLGGEPRRTMPNLYRKMLVLLAKKGLPSRQPYQPPYEYTAIISRQIPDGREIVAWLTQATASAAYDPRPFNSSTVWEARDKLSTLRQALAGRS